jgi:hypothetical protein
MDRRDDITHQRRTKMATKQIPYLLALVCLLSTACTIGVVQRQKVEAPAATAAGTPTLDLAAQATIGALSTQNAALSTQVAADAQVDPTETPTASPTATPVPTTTPTALPTRPPTKVPTPTPTPCTIALGSAFRFRLSSRPEATAALGCPLFGQQTMWTAEQVFQGGRMLWKKDRDLAYILFNDSGTYLVLDDPYIEGDPDDACPELGDAPEGLFKPVRGFNRQWCNTPDVRNRLGWALEKEAGYDATWQEFEDGLALLNRVEHIFILYEDGMWQYVE